MKKTADNSLVQRIAAKRDKVAFEELLSRHQRLLYSIALRVTGRDHLAEEAVQQAMLSVWLTSDKFRESGSVRGWLVAILVSKCTKLLRKNHRQKNQLGLDEQKHLVDSRSSMETYDKEEMLKCVRNLFAALPLQQRKILTLYYSSDLSQREVGEAMQLPQRTVSDQLNKALTLLRTNMMRAGMAAAVPLLGTSGMKEALGSGFEIPLGLSERIIEKVSGYAAGNTSADLPTSKVSTGLAASVLIVLVFGGGLFAWVHSTTQASSTSRSEPRTPSPEEPELANTEANATADSNTKPEPRFYDFESGPPTGFENVFGDERWCNEAWCWGTRKIQTHGLFTYPSMRSCTLLPGTFPAQPFKIEIEHFSVSTGPSNLIFYWSTNQRVINSLVRSNGKAKRTRLVSQPMNWTYYFFENYVVLFESKKMLAIYRYPSPYPAHRILLRGKNLGIEKIKITWLDMKQIPKDALDMDAYFRKKGSMGKETGSFTFSEKRSPIGLLTIERALELQQKRKSR